MFMLYWSDLNGDSGTAVASYDSIAKVYFALKKVQLGLVFKLVGPTGGEILPSDGGFAVPG